MGRLLDALRAQKCGWVGNHKNLINPFWDSCLGLLGSPPSLVSENSSAPSANDPGVDPPVSATDQAVNTIPDPVLDDAAVPRESTKSRDDWEFVYQERAAILEHDAGLSRDDAENQARRMTDAERMGYWSEDEVELYKERIRQFFRRGVPEVIADDLACRLVQRDRDQDDRRSCAECRAFRNGACVQGKVPVCGGGVDVLHRCLAFEFSASKSMCQAAVTAGGRVYPVGQ